MLRSLISKRLARRSPPVPERRPINPGGAAVADVPASLGARPGEWRTIETAPKSSDARVDLWSKGSGRIMDARWSGERWIIRCRMCGDDLSKEITDLTHWMPAPSPPR